MSTECSRSVLSCGRCRRRKTKCDRKLPACTPCLRAKTTCTGFSVTVSSTEVPRSIVRHLEHEIARLETELAQGGHLDALNASDILLQFNQDSSGHQLNGTVVDSSPRWALDIAEPQPVPSQDPLTSSIMNSRELQSMVSATLPYGSGLTDLVSRVRMGLTPSSSTAVTNVNDLQRNSVSPNAVSVQAQVVETRVLRNIPIEIIQSLVKKYVQGVLPQFPFLHEPDIWDQLRHVLSFLQISRQDSQNCLVMPDHGFLVIYLILAISVTLGSAKGGHESRCMSLSSSLFEEGIRHLPSQPDASSDFTGIQMNLLILLYATINPRSANVWILSGAAMRSALELGLHRESPETHGMDTTTLNLRRSVFWSAYCIDRSVCAALQRPLSIPDAAINTQFPYMNDGVTGLSSRPFLDQIHYHQLQSEMIQIHFQGQPLPVGMSWDDWLQNMEKKLQAWYDKSKAEATNSELVEFALARGLTMLHRPSGRTPMPSQRSLLIAFEAAALSARSHREHILSGFFRRPWMSAHHTLETAMVLLFCLRHGQASITQKYNPSQIFDMTKIFTTNFLSIASQGWSEVSNHAGVYERMLGPLLAFVFSPVSNPETSLDSTQDAELMRLLYPGPAHLDKLRFGSRHVEDLGTFDFSLFDIDEDFFDMGANAEVADGTPGTALLDHTLRLDDLGLVF
ncbi:hypothetical protein BU16DRAFT_456433 [Lophium mytilinum]|uniref:Zn(2)-C6 fungal-type domain-containing protein n=1 Tax=Lophium mytilinum TaxID=390894 RepID=A0A6A6QY44_9PEZI|nr:hypothetical protein BU16DRAFT_456433 [Lophium mytilinum]